MGVPFGARSTPTSTSTKNFQPAPSIRRAGTTSRFQKVDMSFTQMRAAVLLTAAGLAATTLSAQSSAQRPMTFEDFAAVRNVGDPQLSPDGKSVLYSLRVTNVPANRRTTVTLLVPIAAPGATRQFPNANSQATEA